MPPTFESKNSIVVLSIDRLGAFALGPYGNTSLETPEFDRLAARSVLFDHALASNIDLTDSYKDFWGGETDGAGSFIQAAKDAGWKTVLLTDDSNLAKYSQASTFDQIQQIDSPLATHAAATAADTQLAHFFACASQCLSDLSPGTLVWMHSRGFSGPWDAPTEYRLAQAGPDDPVPPDFVDPPGQLIELDEVDPDVLLGFEQAYAAQVMLLDQMVGMLVDQLDEDAALASTWFCLTSPRGYPLGQHGVVGAASDPSFSGAALHYENVHVPLLVCPPASQQQLASSRSGKLIQSGALHGFFCNACESETMAVEFLDSYLNSLPDPQVEYAMIASETAAALQTRAWKLIQAGEEQRLYAKPDDRWEVNDVGRRCPQVLELMAELLQQRLADSGGLRAAEQLLPEELTRGSL